MQPLTENVPRSSPISFPALGISLSPPAGITVLGREIFFYGILIALAFLAGTGWCVKKAKHFGIEEDSIYDVLLWLLPASIVGARVYYVLFRLDYYAEHLREIPAIWEGGLAIYGGVIAGILVIAAVCRHKKIRIGAMLDLFAPACLLGQSIGRWGNFFNREAFGRETDFFLRMGLETFSGEALYVHPTFLYESLWNLAGFLLLNGFISSGKRKYNGQCLCLYFLWYGIGRFWIEGLRTDSLFIGSTGIRASQLLSLLLAAGSAVILFLKRKKGGKPRPTA